LSRIALLAATLSLSACASLGRAAVESPDIALQRITLTDISTSGAELLLLLSVDNPNVFTIHGRRLELALDLADVRFGEVTHQDAFSLAGQDTTTVEVPVRVLWSAVGAAARAILMEGEVAYAIEGGVDLETPFGVGRVPYRQSGRMPLYRRTTSAAAPLPVGPTHP